MTLWGNKNGIGKSPVEGSVGPRSPGWGQSRESCSSGRLLMPERTECTEENEPSRLLDSALKRVYSLCSVKQGWPCQGNGNRGADVCTRQGLVLQGGAAVCGVKCI